MGSEAKMTKFRRNSILREPSTLAAGFYSIYCTCCASAPDGTQPLYEYSSTINQECSTKVGCMGTRHPVHVSYSRLHSAGRLVHIAW